MSKLIELAFKLTFFFVSQSDKKRHKNNKKREDVRVHSYPVPNTKDTLNLFFFRYPRLLRPHSPER